MSGMVLRWLDLLCVCVCVVLFFPSLAHFLMTFSPSPPSIHVVVLVVQYFLAWIMVNAIIAITVTQRRHLGSFTQGKAETNIANHPVQEGGGWKLTKQSLPKLHQITPPKVLFEQQIAVGKSVFAPLHKGCERDAMVSVSCHCLRNGSACLCPRNFDSHDEVWCGQNTACCSCQWWLLQWRFCLCPRT